MTNLRSTTATHDPTKAHPLLWVDVIPCARDPEEISFFGQNSSSSKLNGFDTHSKHRKITI